MQTCWIFGCEKRVHKQKSDLQMMCVVCVAKRLVDTIKSAQAVNELFLTRRRIFENATQTNLRNVQ